MVKIIYNHEYYTCHITRLIFIDSVVVKLTLEGKINKKTPQGLDSFYNSTKEIGNIRYDHSQNQLQSTNSSDISSPFPLDTVPSMIKLYRHPYAKVLLQTV